MQVIIRFCIPLLSKLCLSSHWKYLIFLTTSSARYELSSILDKETESWRDKGLASVPKMPSKWGNGCSECRPQVSGSMPCSSIHISLIHTIFTLFCFQRGSLEVPPVIFVSASGKCEVQRQFLVFLLLCLMTPGFNDPGFTTSIPPGTFGNVWIFEISAPRCAGSGSVRYIRNCRY